MAHMILRHVPVFLCLVFPVSLQAAEPTSCGDTVAANLQHARESLAAKTSEAQHAALACLIEALDKINTSSVSAIRSDGDRVIAMPVTAVPINRK